MPALSGAKVWVVERLYSTSLPKLFSSEELAERYVAGQESGRYTCGPLVVDEYASPRIGDEKGNG